MYFVIKNSTKSTGIIKKLIMLSQHGMVSETALLHRSCIKAIQERKQNIIDKGLDTDSAASILPIIKLYCN